MNATALERALKMFRENRFLTLATSSEQGPWATPINYVIGPGPHLHFYSAVESRHSADVARDPRASFAVFDSTASSDEVDGMQVRARCEVVSGEELESVSEYYFRVNFPDPEDREWWYRPSSAFREPEPWRFYRLVIEEVFVIDMDSITETKVDRRLPVPLGEVLRGLAELNR